MKKILLRLSIIPAIILFMPSMCIVTIFAIIGWFMIGIKSMDLITKHGDLYGSYVSKVFDDTDDKNWLT